MSTLETLVPRNGDLLLLGVPLLLAALLFAESFLPLRRARYPAARRWVINAMLYLINVSIAATLEPGQWALGGGIVKLAEEALGPLAAGALGLLALDLGFYVLHRLQHASFYLWRLHAVHHSDLDVDVTTAVRHHPAEFLVNCLVLGALSILLGIPTAIIALYGAIAISLQMIQHANISWPAWAERLAGMLIVTPSLHHRHHSRDSSVSNMNFGVVLSVWDRFFHTLDRCSTVVVFGVSNIDEQRCRTLWAVLALPMTKQSRDAPTADQ